MITATGVMPRNFDQYAFSREFYKASNAFGEEIRQEFHKTIATWRNRPQFKKRVVQNANETSVHVMTEGKTPPGVRPKTPEDIYCMLAGGTSKRYAVMTRDFSPKTMVGIIDSFAGSGGFSHLDMNEDRAIANAIKARNWDIVIKQQQERRMRPIFETALRNGVTASGHRYA